MSYYHYIDLTGDLIVINQLAPFIVKGNLLIEPILDSVKILDGRPIFEAGIKFPNLLTELSSYFTKWTITINIYSDSEGELWNNIPVILFTQGDNILYEFNTNTDYYNIDYTLNNYNIKNYLYRGYNSTYNNNDENKNYITYEQKTNKITLKVKINEYKGELQLIHDFLNTDYPSGDIIIKSPEGTMRDTYIKNIIISTTDTYTGDSLYYEIEEIVYENNNLFNILYNINNIEYNKDNLFNLLYKINNIEYNKDINKINFKIGCVNYNIDNLIIINFLLYRYLPVNLTDTVVYLHYPDSLEFPGFVKADKEDNTEIYDTETRYRIFDEKKIIEYKIPKLTNTNIFINYPDSLEFPGIVEVSKDNSTEIIEQSRYNIVKNGG